jgi:hypothetical protein
VEAWVGEAGDGTVNLVTDLPGSDSGVPGEVHRRGKEKNEAHVGREDGADIVGRGGVGDDGPADILSRLDEVGDEGDNRSILSRGGVGDHRHADDIRGRGHSASGEVRDDGDEPLSSQGGVGQRRQVGALKVQRGKETEADPGEPAGPRRGGRGGGAATMAVTVMNSRKLLRGRGWRGQRSRRGSGRRSASKGCCRGARGAGSLHPRHPPRVALFQLRLGLQVP